MVERKRKRKYFDEFVEKGSFLPMMVARFNAIAVQHDLPPMSCPRLGRKTIVGVPGEVLSKDVKDFGALENLVASWVTMMLVRSIFSTNKHKQT